MHGFVLHEARDAVGQLNLVAGAAPGRLQLVEDPRCQQIPPHHGQVGRGVFRLRFLDDALDPARAGWLLLHRDDAVTGCAFPGHGLPREHTASMSLMVLPHLLQARRVAVNEIVGQVNIERLVPDRRAGAKHRVTQPQRYPLAQENAARRWGQNCAHRGQQFGLSGLLQRLLQFGIDIEVVFDTPLAGGRDEDQLLRTCRDRFLHRVLDQRFVDDGEHFLGRRLGRRQKTAAAASDRKDGGAYDGTQRGVLPDRPGGASYRSLETNRAAVLAGPA